MNNFEKFIFLELTWKQFAKLDSSDYYKTIASLSKQEEELSIKMSNEIHEIYNYLNSNFEGRKKVDSIFEYNEQVSPVSDLILKVASDFELTLKGEISEEFKKAIFDILGKEYLDRFLDQTNN